METKGDLGQTISQPPVCTSVRGVPPARYFTDILVRTNEAMSPKIHWVVLEGPCMKDKCDEPSLDLNK